MMKVLLKSGKIIAPESNYHQQTLDILIDNGKIVKIAPEIETTVDHKIAGDNLHVSTGWFDSSVSFGEPGYEERETLYNGLQTAAKSGFSAVALNPDTQPVTDHRTAVEFLKQQAAKGTTQLHPIGALTQGAKGEALAELYDMHLAGAVGFGDYKNPVRHPELLKIALQYTQSFDGLVIACPDDYRLTKDGVMNEGSTSTRLGVKGIPAFVEEMQISRDLALLNYTGGKLHIPTISTAKSAQLIAEAKQTGLNVSCSVAIHNLWFNDERLADYDTAFKVRPPLRHENDRKALIKAVDSGVIDMVTSDHRPLNIERKKRELDHADNGTIGLESVFGALHNYFDIEKTIALLTAGRERFQIDAPRIAEGAKAELTLFNPDKKYKFDTDHILSASTNSMFLGMQLQGQVIGTIANNQITLV